MWFIGVDVEYETSAPPPKKNPGSAPAGKLHVRAFEKKGMQSIATSRKLITECFHSCGYCLCKCIATKESVYIRKRVQLSQD